jgi:hypothetical protein
MMQVYATNTAGNAQMWILDMMPDETTGIPASRAASAGDPVTVRLLWDYQTAAEACERNPLRYKPEQMPDADHALLVKAFEARQLALSAAPLPPANAPDSPFGWNRPA